MSMPFVSFGHPITRAYNLSWFKWVVLIGGILGTVLVTALNLAANGYVLKLQYTQDFNGTTKHKLWTSRFPFNILNQATISCQSVEMPVNSQFWTDKLSLRYTITRAWQYQNDTIVDTPAITYTNNRLENCGISYIKVDLSPLDIVGTQLIAPWAEDVSPVGTGDLTWCPKATAYVNCTISNSVHPTTLSLVADYSSLNSAGEMQSFPREPKEEQASLWWGKSLLSWYWSYLACSDGKEYTTGAMDLLPRKGIHNGTISIRDDNFFWVSGYWFRTAPGVQADTWSTDNPVVFPDKSPCIDCPDIGAKIDLFAKAMYAMVLADLGEHSDQTHNSNVLLQPHLLQHLSANISNLKIQAHKPWWIPSGPSNRSYGATHEVPLNITDSYIYNQYLCQIPTLKPLGELLVSVIVANLVLLEALWKLLNWGTTVWLERKDPHANFCEGCLHFNQSDSSVSQRSRPKVKKSLVGNTEVAVASQPPVY